MPRELYKIATDIKVLWKKPNYAAVPYIEAMFHLNNMDDMYGADSAQSVVLYFLNNATHWIGPDARRIKEELKDMLHEHGYPLPKQKRTRAK